MTAKKNINVTKTLDSDVTTESQNTTDSEDSRKVYPYFQLFTDNSKFLYGIEPVKLRAIFLMVQQCDYEVADNEFMLGSEFKQQLCTTLKISEYNLKKIIYQCHKDNLFIKIANKFYAANANLVAVGKWPKIFKLLSIEDYPQLSCSSNNLIKRSEANQKHKLFNLKDPGGLTMPKFVKIFYHPSFDYLADLTPGELTVLLNLFEHYYRHLNKEFIQLKPTLYKTISKETGLSERFIKSTIKKLCDNDLIRQLAPDKNMLGSIPKYKFNPYMFAFCHSHAIKYLRSEWDDESNFIK